MASGAGRIIRRYRLWADPLWGPIHTRLEVTVFPGRTSSFRHSCRPLSIIDRPPLRGWRTGLTLRARLDLVEVRTTPGTDVFRDHPWLSLKFTLRI